MSNQLTKADAARKRVKPETYSLFSALKNGGPIVWLSCLIMGLGNIFAGQFIKGLLFLAIEVLVILYMINPVEGGFYWLSKLITLGDVEDTEVFNDELGIFEYVTGDRSQQILLFGVLQRIN